MSGTNYVEVGVCLPIFQTYFYEIPPQLEPVIAIGQRVVVLFGKRRVVGYVLGFSRKSPDVEIKPVEAVLDTHPTLNSRMLTFLKWIANYYHYPIGEVIKAALPSGINVHGSRRLFITDQGRRQLEKGASQNLLSWQKMILIVTRRRRNGVTLKDLQQVLNIKISERRLKQLISLGWLSTSDTNIVSKIKPKRSEPVGLEEKGVQLPLTDGQQRVCRTIKSAISTASFSPFLLHGITGSGKTEVYIRSIHEALKLGRQIIYLVPEISLTPQLIGRLQVHFRGSIAVLHSHLSEGERYDNWLRIKRGEVSIAIGARSAIFAPFERLGLIIVDEEHDNSFKQDSQLKYNARDIALVRGQIEKASVILGSATPSVDSFYNVTRKKIRYLNLPSRVQNAPLPKIDLVDLSAGSKKTKHLQLFSVPLVTAVRETISKGEQVLLFLNRRGYSTTVICQACGFVHYCPNCSIALTHHNTLGGKTSPVLYCHYCTYHEPLPSRCKSCGTVDISLLGVGTEKLEEQTKILFPQARIARLDSDITSKKGALLKTLLAVQKGEVDILIGTQMIAKGHDFPKITLVGVVLADSSLHFPDFRAPERTFQMITQVSGRSGRGSRPGRVIIQTYHPDHYAIQAARKQNFGIFWDKEMSYRHDLCYPPFWRLVNFRISSNSEDKVKTFSECLKRKIDSAIAELESKGTSVVLGPSPAPIGKIKGRHRWQILLKAESPKVVQSLLNGLQPKLGDKTPGVQLSIDVDPVNLL